MIPYGRQSIDQADIDSVVDVLRSDFLTQGPAVPNFEMAIAEYCNSAHAVAVNSATSALHIACLALGVGPGDLVWTTPNTFVASANCARYCGASVDLVDIEPMTFNMSVEHLKEKLCNAAKQNLLPKVVIPVHFAGQPCDMAEIKKLADQYEFRVIEDASHAIGSRYADSITGDCAYSDITVFSFHPVKIITTGEGGLATTQSPELARRMQLLRSHGITRENSELEDSDQGAWYYEQQSLGFNYRLTDIQAAIGLSQLRNLDKWIATRHEIADRYDRELEEVQIDFPKRFDGRYSALHLYCIQVEDRRHVFDGMRQAGIGVNVHYIPVHKQPYYRALFPPGYCLPNAERFYERAVSIPMHVRVTHEQQTQVIQTLIGLCK